MRIRFDILFEVVFEHDYFEKGLIPGLEIEPAQRTREILQNYGLLFKRTGKGFVVLYEKDTSDIAEPPLKAITSDERFSFEIFFSDSCFTNYTLIPLNHKYPGFFYFDNLTENIADTDLFLNRLASAGSSDIVEISSDIYNIEKASGNSSALIEISDLSGVVVFTKTVRVKDGLLLFQIDFGGIGSGRYDINIDGTLYRKIYVDRETYRKSLFGNVDIFKSDEVPSAYKFAGTDGSVNSKIYKIRFARRTTTWKYYVVLRNINADPGFSILYGAKIEGEGPYPDIVTFNSVPPDPNMVTEYGPGRVLLFKSDVSLPLYEIPKTNIRLIRPDSDDPGSEPDVVIDDMPNATVTAIKTDPANTETFSEIFIYV